MAQRDPSGVASDAAWERSECAPEGDLGAVQGPKPARNARAPLQRPGRLELGPVERGLDHRIVPADQDRHDRSHPAARPRLEDVGQPAWIRADRFEHEAVTPGQTAAWGELEEDPPARLVLDHRVADGPVTAVGADTERAVEDHRFGNPDVRRPQPILGGANRGSRRLAQAAPPWRNTRSR